MNKHLEAIFLYFSVAVLSTFTLLTSPKVTLEPCAGRMGGLPVAANSARNGTCRSPATPGSNARVSKIYGQLPLYFIENRGQVNRKVSFYTTGPGHAIFFTRKGVVLSLRRVKGKVNHTRREAANPQATPEKWPDRSVAAVQSLYLGIEMLGMNKDVRIVPEEAQPGKVNYFIGNRPRKWYTDIKTYGAVLYKNAYPGIDVKFYGNNRRLEYDIIVKPGADPSKVRFQYSGARDVHVTTTGDLAVELSNGRIVFKKPGIYQELNGRRVLRQGKFEVRQDKAARDVLNVSDRTAVIGAKIRTFTCSFDVGTYDRKTPLVIDPVLVYSTCIGGSGNDEAYGIATDSNGNTYIVGRTTSTDFPAANAIQSNNYGGGNWVTFITEIATDGSNLVYSTYLGGSGDTEPNGIALDSSGNAYIAGWTNSTDLPVSNSLQSNNTGGYDAFVTEIAAGGKSLVYSTYLGGTGDDFANSIAVDGSGNAYVTGGTFSTDLPVRNAVFPYLTGAEEAFVTEIAAGGKSLVYSTYLGGGNDDEAWAIAVDGSGNAYVTGLTLSADFPIKNALQPNFAGGTNYGDCFVTEIAHGGGSLLFSTYLGGSKDDAAYGITVDGSGNVYITGSTSSSDFPTDNPVQSTFGGRDWDAFVTEIAAGGKSLVYSTYLGGSNNDWGTHIAVDNSGNAYVAGATFSTDFPVSNSLQPNNAGGYDAFVTEVAAGGKDLIYSTYFGGTGDDVANGIAVDNSGDVYVTGSTESIDFPSEGALLYAFGGGNDDAFIVEIMDLWQAATDIGNHWMSLDWFGSFYIGNSLWIYHATLGWLYPVGTSTDNIWFYDPQWDGNGGWWWTSNSVYPWIYSYTEGGWFYYDASASNPGARWFWNSSTGWAEH